MTRPASTRAPGALRRFARAEEGAVSVETVVMAPVLLATLLTMAVFWDGFRAKNAALKAATTISDAISRETAPIDADYIERMDALYGFLAGARGDTSLRVSVVANALDDGGDEELELRWSAVAGDGMAEARSAGEIAHHVPEMAVGDQIILVESETDWTPPFDTTFAARTFTEVTVSRARFVPQVLWSDD